MSFTETCLTIERKFPMPAEEKKDFEQLLTTLSPTYFLTNHDLCTHLRAMFDELHKRIQELEQENATRSTD